MTGVIRREAYLEKRRQFMPAPVRLVIVAESPPASGKYFYDASGRTTEPLFKAMMKQLSASPATKESGLREFQRRGWLLIDATYQPVNALSRAERDRIILRDYPLLRSDIEDVLESSATSLVLIKANVCQLLEARLAEDGFNVLNRGRKIYFPSTGRQAEFGQQFGEVLGSNGVAL